MREEYLRPVGFAREPAEERKRWVLRIITIAFVVFIVWLLWAKVIHTPPEPSIQPPGTSQSVLSAPA